VNQQNLYSIILLILLTTSTAFTRLLIAGQPIWLLASVMILFASIAFGAVRQSSFIFGAEILKIAIPWIGYSMWIAIRDEEWTGQDYLLHEGQIRSILNIATLLLFLSTLLISRSLSEDRVFTILALIACIYGCVAVLQTQGVEMFINMPNLFVTNPSEIIDYNYDVQKANSFRARGFDQYVHKFSAYQGILVAVMMTFTILKTQQRSFSNTQTAFFYLTTTIALFGVVVTFSRAPIYGIITIVLWITLYAVRSAYTVIGLLMTIGLTSIIMLVGEFYMNRETAFARLLVIDRVNSNDEARFNTWIQSFEAFLEHPIIGCGSLSNSNNDLVTHNVPLRILGDFGTIGFIMYSMVWLMIIKIARANILSVSNQKKCVGFILASASIAAFADSLFHSSGLLQRDTAQAAILGVCVGLCTQNKGTQGNLQLPAVENMPIFKPS
jgi:O-antigen ligase